MVLKFYGSSFSTCSKRVAVVLHEKNVPFEFHHVDLYKDEHKTPEFKKKQPFGQVPYLDDDGFIVYESRAIARYVEEKYPNQGTELIPTEIKERALFEQAASVELANFDAYAAPAVAEVVFKQHLGLQTDAKVLEQLTTALSAKLNVYEEILSKQKYLAGDKITLADLFHLPYGSMLPVAGINLIQERPNVARWFNDLTSRPTWQAVKDDVKSTA